MFYDWQSRAGNAKDLLEFAKTRNIQVDDRLVWSGLTIKIYARLKRRCRDIHHWGLDCRCFGVHRYLAVFSGFLGIPFWPYVRLDTRDDWRSHYRFFVATCFDCRVSDSFNNSLG